MTSHTHLPAEPDTLSIEAPRAVDPTAQLEPLAVPFGRIGGILRRHLWVVVATFCIGVGGTAVVVKQMPKKYTAEASILIELQRSQVSDLQAISTDVGDIGSLVRTQIDVLRSPALRRNVVEALGLTNIQEFAPHGGGPLAQANTLLERFGLHPHTESHIPTVDEAVQTATAVLGGKISFANETRSGVLTVQVTTRGADLSARIANEVVKQFLDFKRQEKFAAMQRAHDWLQEQLGTLTEQVPLADAAVEKYRKQHRLEEEGPSEVPGVQTQTVNRQQLDALSSRLVDVSRERAHAEAQMAQAQMALHGELRPDALPDVLGSQVVAQLQAQTAIVAGREAQLAVSQGSENPELTSVRAQLRKLQARMQQEMANVVASLGTEVKAEQAQEGALQRQLEQLRAAVAAENSAEVGLQALQTKARATHSIYESFFNRATQLANVAGIQEPDASLVSSARSPLSPSSPQGGRLLMVAAVLSTVLSLTLACVAERLRPGFGSPEQAEAILGVPVVAIVPEVRRRSELRKPNAKNMIPFTAALDRLRGQLRALDDRRPKVVMITSALPGEGKSVLAAGLARNTAAAGWHVLLLECDFRRPSIAAHFGLPPAPGLREMLVGRMLGECASVLHEPLPRLHVIPAGSIDGDPQELLLSARMAQLLDVFRSRYDLVILDTPPVLPVPDALVLARLADALLLLVRWEASARAAVQDALQLLQGRRTPIMGTVLSRMDLRKAAFAGGRMAYVYKHYSRYPVARATHS